MSDDYNIGPDKAIYQLTNTVMALSRVLAQVSPELTQGHLAMAVEGSRKAGHGTDLVEEIYKSVFPNAKPTVMLSPEEFARKQRELGQ
ncbi:hypothetical protein [Pseudomonas soli]|uniref:hypothetical protein n=1 Tax=Pseudomonas soli TaxID=1306993 RepID=UPI000F4D3137